MAAAWAFIFLSFLSFSFGGLITDLPNAPAVSFKQYAGYLNVTKTRHMHYWFTESQSDPTNDPVLLWLTGGPGCSGLSAVLTEFGPYTAQPDGLTLTINPDSWNKKASILTIESPIGVGFSYAEDGNVASDDDKTANENWEALKAFFTEFPEFRKNDFYLTGESYGGIFVPTLADKILKKQSDFQINLKGMAIGNGCVNESIATNTLVQFAYSHGMVDETTWQQVKDQCCDGKIDGCNFSGFTGWGFCASFVEETSQNIWFSGINPYDLYSNCVSDDASKRKLKRPNTHAKLDFMQRIKSLRSRRPPDSRSTTTCLDEFRETNYLNQPSVKKALFVADNLPAWTDCTDDVYYGYEQIYLGMDSFVKNAVDSGVRLLIYNGDTDLVCNFLMGQQFTAKLGYPQTSAKKSFLTNKQVAGFHTQYGKAEFATVLGAGHLVPTDKPGAAFHVIDAFLNGQLP